MAKGCGCAGQSCGCAIKAGTGIKIEGTGTASSPFVVSLNAGESSIKPSIQSSASTSAKITITGGGTSLDPLVLQAAVEVASPDGRKWTIAVSNAGVLSAVAV